MSSINDVLKEKFGVTGSNIAETLSNITPGEGGGSGGGTEWLFAHLIEDEERGVIQLDKTFKEIYDAMPFVMVIDNTEYSKSAEIVQLVELTEEGYCAETSSDVTGRYYASSVTDYPSQEIK